MTRFKVIRKIAEIRGKWRNFAISEFILGRTNEAGL